MKQAIVILCIIFIMAVIALIIKNNKDSLIPNNGIVQNKFGDFKDLILQGPPKQDLYTSRKTDNLDVTYTEGTESNGYGCLDTYGTHKKNYTPPKDSKGIRKSNPDAIVTNQEFDEYLMGIFSRIEQKIPITEPSRRMKKPFDSSDVMANINELLKNVNEIGNFKFHIMEMTVLNTSVDDNSKYYDMRIILYNTMGYGSMKTIDTLIVKRNNEETGKIETFYHTISLVGYNNIDSGSMEFNLNGYDDDKLNTYGDYKLPHSIDPKLNNEVTNCVNNRNLLCRSYPRLDNIATSEEIYA
jgi:hypothetical protein